MGEGANLVGDHGETAALLAGASRLDGRVERQGDWSVRRYRGSRRGPWKCPGPFPPGRRPAPRYCPLLRSSGGSPGPSPVPAGVRSAPIARRRTRRPRWRLALRATSSTAAVISLTAVAAIWISSFCWVSERLPCSVTALSSSAAEASWVAELPICWMVWRSCACMPWRATSSLAGSSRPEVSMRLVRIAGSDHLGHSQRLADRLGDAAGEQPGQYHGSEAGDQQYADHCGEGAVIDLIGRVAGLAGALDVEVDQRLQLLLVARYWSSKVLSVYWRVSSSGLLRDICTRVCWLCRSVCRVAR